MANDENQQAVEEAINLREQARKLLDEGKYAKALLAINQAIIVDNSTTKNITTRAEIYIAVKDYTAAIKDCDEALSLNPDCPRAFKFRGRAHHLLGESEKAWYDYGHSLGIDESEDVITWMAQIKDRVMELQKAKHHSQ